MRRWGPIALVLAAAVATAPAAVAAPPTATLAVTGLGGQTAVLTAPRGGLDVAYPFFTEPRLAGPNGAVGGVVIQRVADRRLVGGLILQNAPGFNRAIPIPLVDFDHTVLPAGRYRLTLLGTGKQVVHLMMRRTTKSLHLAARGRSRPITRVVAATSPVAATWSDALGRIGPSDYVVTGGGSGGEWQQASDDDMCLQVQGVLSAPCVAPGAITVTPGDGAAGTWSGQLYRPGAVKPGAYVFSGRAIGMGPSSITAHAAVVISLAR